MGPFVRPARFQRLLCWLWICRLRWKHYENAAIGECPFCLRGVIERRDGTRVP